MDIKDTFLKLTSRTYPHRTESELLHLLPIELETDEFGNKFLKIGESPSCMFTSHLDTATSANTVVNHVIKNNIISTDGKSILGADDKAGVTVMLFMIENKVPGLYYFFLGEEVGCVGSKKLSGKLKSKIEDKTFSDITKVISFDRRGYDSVITFQSSSRCCSDEFAKALSEEFNKVESSFSYKPDPTGVYTDSAQFTRIYPECTNISVGYKSEHTFSEQQDIAHLELLAKACIAINWESLPVVRDKDKYEYSYSGYSNHGYDDYGYGSAGYSGVDYKWSGGARDRYSYDGPADESFYFIDPDYEFVSAVKQKKYTKKFVSIDLCEERVSNERSLILDLLDSLEVKYEVVEWDGSKLSVKHAPSSGGHTTVCTREEIAEFLPEFDFWKKEIETYKDGSIHDLVY